MKRFNAIPPPSNLGKKTGSSISFKNSFSQINDDNDAYSSGRVSAKSGYGRGKALKDYFDDDDEEDDMHGQPPETFNSSDVEVDPLDAFMYEPPCFHAIISFVAIDSHIILGPVFMRR